MTELTLETLRGELASLEGRLRSDLATRKDLDTFSSGLSLIGTNVHQMREDIREMRQDIRMLRAAVNDMARINITGGEVEALHDDLQRVIAKQDNLEARLLVLEERTP